MTPFESRLAEFHAAADSYWPRWRHGSEQHRAENKATAKAILALVEAAEWVVNPNGSPFSTQAEAIHNLERVMRDTLSRSALEALNRG